MKTPELVITAGGILCGAPLLAILLWLGNDLYVAVITRNWNTVSAKVLSSEIVEKQRPASGRYGKPPRTNYSIEISYAYNVAGRTYSSTRYSFSKALKATSREHAEHLRRPYLAGSETIAYYDPAEPARSVLVAGWRGISLVAASLGGGIASLGVAVLARVVWDTWAGKGRSRRRKMAKRHL